MELGVGRYVRTTRFGGVESDGRRKVYWLLDGDLWPVWVHKGWLMPEV